MRNMSPTPTRETTTLHDPQFQHNDVAAGDLLLDIGKIYSVWTPSILTTSGPRAGQRVSKRT